MDGLYGLAAYFAKRSTSAERIVIVWLLIIASVGVGTLCLYLAFTAPADKAGEAAQLRWYGFGFLGFAALVWITRSLIAWILDR